MTPLDISILVNTGLSIAEMLLRYQQTSPELFRAEEEKLGALKHKIAALEAKPIDYLQKWDGEK